MNHDWLLQSVDTPDWWECAECGALAYSEQCPELIGCPNHTHDDRDDFDRGTMIAQLPQISRAAILGFVLTEARHFASVKGETVRVALDVGAGTYQRYESGARTPHDRVLAEIERCLRTPPGTLRRRTRLVERALQPCAYITTDRPTIDQRPLIQRMLTCIACGQNPVVSILDRRVDSSTLGARSG